MTHSRSQRLSNLRSLPVTLLVLVDRETTACPSATPELAAAAKVQRWASSQPLFYRSASVLSTSQEGSENPNKTGKAESECWPCLSTVPRRNQGPGDRGMPRAPQQPPAKLGLGPRPCEQ